ncbi:WPP domain-associated protein-like isoform X1 [Zingiber officinale]|nr:WPP domain-associated protein-like isoform X1 [Zingiber officinale]XP_042381411.1 WPP domain-associated protein-like isoform X1 [Zingiber officinale]
MVWVSSWVIHIPVLGSMENKILELENELSVDHDVASLCEKFLLEESDSYFDDVYARLTVSRMVSDSVIRGIVRAIEAEAAERVALKEAEILAMEKKLQLCKSNMIEENWLDMKIRKETSIIDKLGFYQNYLGERVGPDCVACFSELKLALQDHLTRLKEEIKDLIDSHILPRPEVCPADKEFCNILVHKLNVMDGFADALKTLTVSVQQKIDTFLFLKDIISEQELEKKFQQEVIATVLQSLIKEQQDDFEANLSKRNVLVDTFIDKWKKTMDRLSTMRQELDAISASLLSSEQALAFSHHSPAVDLSKVIIADSPELKHRSKDDQIAYYKTEIAKMKLQHELALRDKTEELFRLKRDYLNEKGSHAHFKRDKENERLKKNLLRFISTLDNVLLENDELSLVQIHENILLALNQRFDYENRQLISLLADKKKELMCITTAQAPNDMNQSTTFSKIDRDFLEQRTMVKLDAEDVKLDSIIREEIQKIVFKDLSSKLEVEMMHLDLEFKIAQDITQDICFSSCREFLKDVISSVNPLMEKHHKEKDYFAAAVLEKEKTLSLKMEENKKLKQDKERLSTLIKEKEELLLSSEINIMRQKGELDKVCSEINILRGQLSDQSLCLTAIKEENDSLKETLAKTLKQVQQYENELKDVTQNHKNASHIIKELEKQRKFLQDLVAENQMKLATFGAREQEHLKFMTIVTSSITVLSENVLQLECRLADKLGFYKSRLEFIIHQFSDLFQLANILKNSAFWYKQGFERKCSDLQKAETEVDLLGDDVEILLRLLEKIYVALEHYSPVLQHYPGVVEILKLIRREMKSNPI